MITVITESIITGIIITQMENCFLYLFGETGKNTGCIIKMERCSGILMHMETLQTVQQELRTALWNM